ncbi:hypothetical protein C0V75_13865 [Tabrizicola sp. TH137]|uniref:LytTR family DNA-binding domain-containing protein n=1 Tax=Tabrizicola sp. TH137 TaxID=2067452 RepID=UPI000C7D9717|nr:LytTR family DNA-binding domain-containing protein [Tabrizicola sp. TH137]PLL11978.1 hypothetical protein C0V75_13865 [Tabrizicola sp. TH137]
MTQDVIDRQTTLEVELFSGDRVRFHRFELPKALFHRYSLLIYMALAAFLSQTQLFHALVTLSSGQRVLIVCFCILTALVPIALWVLALEWLQKPGTVRRLNAPPQLLVFALFPTVAYVYLIYVRPGRDFGEPMHFVVIWVWLYVLLEIEAHVLLLLLMRPVLQDMRGRQVAVALDPVAAAELEIKGQRVKVGELYRVTAEGNYIRVITAQGQHFLPGPFGPVADALPEGLGMRVSRSDWVARGAVMQARRKGRDVTLDLLDGSAVRVAQARRKAVLDWIEGPGQGGASAEGWSERSTQTG